MDPIFVSSDTGSEIVVTIKKADGTVLDLTGSTVTLTFDVDAGVTVSKRTVTMTLDADPTTGIATYLFKAGELKAPGKNTSTLRCEIRVTDSGGKTLTALGLIVAPIRARMS